MKSEEMRILVKVLTGIGAALAAAVVAGGLLVGQAFAVTPAQPPVSNPGCGAALLALTQADKAASDAAAADAASADAKKADDALADALAAVDTARATAVNGGVATKDLTDSGAALRTEKTTLLAKPLPRSPEDTDRLITIDAQLQMIDAFVAAQAKATAAKVAADKTDAEALRREADKTDTAALVDAAGKAGDAADVACGRNAGVRFENCDQVRAAGKAPLRSTEPGYRLRLDVDRDGLACEAVEGTPAPPVVKLPTAVDTGYAA